jgi:hypothetical protein
MPDSRRRLDSASRLNQADAATAHVVDKSDPGVFERCRPPVSHCSPHLVVIDFLHANEKENSKEDSLKEKDRQDSEEEALKEKGCEEKGRKQETKPQEGKHPFGKLRSP